MVTVTHEGDGDVTGTATRRDATQRDATRRRRRPCTVPVPALLRSLNPNGDVRLVSVCARLGFPLVPANAAAALESKACAGLLALAIRLCGFMRIGCGAGRIDNWPYPVLSEPTPDACLSLSCRACLNGTRFRFICGLTRMGCDFGRIGAGSYPTPSHPISIPYLAVTCRMRLSRIRFRMLCGLFRIGCCSDRIDVGSPLGCPLGVRLVSARCPLLSAFVRSVSARCPLVSASVRLCPLCVRFCPLLLSL